MQDPHPHRWRARTGVNPFTRMTRRKEIFALGMGVVLLSLLVLPKLAPEGPAAPMSLRLVRYETNSASSQTEAVLEARNNSGRLIFFGISQPEFLQPAHPWETSSMETNYPVARLNPRETSVIRIAAPPEARVAAWRLPFYCSMTSSRMQRRLGRVLSFLKIKEVEPPTLAGLLYSEEFPSASRTSSE